MTINKNTGKVLFEIEKTALFIVSLIVAVNLTINGLVVLFSSSTFAYFIQQLLLNIVLFGFVYLIIYAINQVITSIPFLVSLNCPRKLLAKNIILAGFKRSLTVSLLIFVVRMIVFRLETGLSSYLTSIFGINLTSGDLGNLLLISGILYLLLHLVYSLVTLLSLLGVSFGWEAVLSAVFIIMGIFFLSFKSIVLLFIFGWQINIFIFLLFILIILFNLLNYRMIMNYEFKY